MIRKAIKAIVVGNVIPIITMLLVLWAFPNPVVFIITVFCIVFPFVLIIASLLSPMIAGYYAGKWDRFSKWGE